MLKKTSIFFLGYFIILCILLIINNLQDKFTPSIFGKWATIITPIYILVFILIVYLKKRNHEKNL
jgi:hypothetical protein